MKKFLAFALSLGVAGLLMAGCGSSSSSGADPFTITSDDAPDATFTSMAVGNVEQGLFWAADELWDSTLEARLPAKAGAGGKRSAKMSAAARSGAVVPTATIPTDQRVDDWCGDGYATINGTVNYNDLTQTGTANITATFTNYDTCYGSVINGDATIVITAIDLDDGDPFFDTVNTTITMDQLTVESYPGLVLVLTGKVQGEGDFDNESYAFTMNASTSGGEIDLKFVDFKVFSDESFWPQVTGTIGGTIYADGKYVKVSTVEDIHVNDMEDNPAPDQGVLLLNGDGKLTVTFGLDVDGETILLELDGNEDGDYLDTADWTAGPMYWNEFFSLLSFTN